MGLLLMIKLPRLPYGWKDQPQLFERYWHEAMSQIEKNINDLLSIPAIEAAIVAAQTAADNANAAAANVTSDSSLINSYVDSASYSGSLITCDNAGSITIQTHTRVYGDSTLNPSVSVTGATITATGAVAGDIVRIYYNDSSRTGGAVTYSYTIDPAAPPVQKGTVHSVGVVEVPVVGTTDGQEIKNPGYVYL